MDELGPIGRITNPLLKRANSRGALYLTVFASASGLNVVAGDQYIALVLPARTYRAEVKSEQPATALPHERGKSVNRRDSAHMSFWSNIWDTTWWFLTIFIFIAYLMALFSIIGDLFRDRKMNGVSKAIWLLLLVFVPFLTAFAYLIFRGRGMAERTVAQQRAAQDQAEEYIRSVSGTGPTAEIAQAKQLLDSGTIDATEFEALKSAALGKVGAA